MAKDAYYFPHDSNARTDPKLTTLMADYGLLGYAYYFILIEILREQEYYRLRQTHSNALAIAWQLPTERIAPILRDFSEIGLITISDDGFIFSESLNRRMAEFDRKKQIRSDAGRAGAAKLWQTHGKRMRMHGKERRVKESKEEIQPRFDFETIWNKYPNKDGRKQAERSFKATVKTEQDWSDINQALDNYMKSEKVKKGFIKNGSTWFNNWRDWINYVEPEVEGSDGLTPALRESLRKLEESNARKRVRNVIEPTPARL